MERSSSQLYVDGIGMGWLSLVVGSLRAPLVLIRFSSNLAKAGLWPARPRLGSLGQDSVQAGTFWGFLNVLLRGGSQVTFMTHLEKVIIFRNRHFFVTNRGFQLTF